MSCYLARDQFVLLVDDLLTLLLLRFQIRIDRSLAILVEVAADNSINMWSTENAGTLDFNAEVELWTRAGHIKTKLGKGVDVRKIDNLIGWAVLNG